MSHQYEVKVSSRFAALEKLLNMMMMMMMMTMMTTTMMWMSVGYGKVLEGI
jgi:hypothetical protein